QDNRYRGGLSKDSFLMKAKCSRFRRAWPSKDNFLMDLDLDVWPREKGDRYARAHEWRKICGAVQSLEKKKIGPDVIREMIEALANSFTSGAVKAAEKQDNHNR
ncbi:1692_t:CDS:2, partial [Funneliformis mosseae]